MASSARNRRLQHPRRRHHSGDSSAFLKSPTARATATTAARSKSTGLFYINERLEMGLGRRPAVGQVVPAELPHPERKPRVDTTSRNRSRPSTCRARATAPSSTSAAIISRACPPPTGRSSSRSSIRCWTTTSASRPRPSAASSPIDVNVTSLSRQAAQFEPMSVPNTTYCSALYRTCIDLRSRPMPRPRRERHHLARLRQRRPGAASSSIPSVRSGRLSPIVRADIFWISPDFDGLPEQRA